MTPEPTTSAGSPRSRHLHRWLNAKRTNRNLHLYDGRRYGGCQSLERAAELSELRLLVCRSHTCRQTENN